MPNRRDQGVYVYLTMLVTGAGHYRGLGELHPRHGARVVVLTLDLDFGPGRAERASRPGAVDFDFAPAANGQVGEL